MLSTLNVLHIVNVGIAGSMPSELRELKQLTSLDFQTNSLTGPVPSQLGLLTKLKGFYMYSNQLTGSIPSQLGLLTRLTVLGLPQQPTQRIHPLPAWPIDPADKTGASQ